MEIVDQGRPGETLERTASRLAFMDNLRIGLTVLVVLHHVALAYGGSGLAFYFVDLPAEGFSRGLLVFALINQAWFMGAFFLVAGYFTPKSYDRQGAGGFLRSRVVRLGVPLTVYAFVLNPIAFTGGFHMPESIKWVTPDTFSYFENVRMGPTWFLALLLIFSFGYVACRMIPTNRPAADSTAPFPGFPVLIAAVVVLAGLTYLIRHQVSVGEEFAGFPSLAYLPQYLLFFAAGAFAARRDWATTIPRSTGLISLGVGLGAMILLFPVAFSGQMFSLELTDTFGRAIGDGYRDSAIYALWDSLQAVGLTLGLIVVLRLWFDRQGSLGRFLSLHSYAVYLVHIPVVVYVAVLLSKTDLSHPIKLTLAIVLAPVLSWLVAGAVRRIPGATRVI